MRTLTLPTKIRGRIAYRGALTVAGRTVAVTLFASTSRDEAHRAARRLLAMVPA